MGTVVACGVSASVAQAQVSCDLLFREVAELAPIVAVVEVDAVGRDMTALKLIELLRGELAVGDTRVPAAPILERAGTRRLHAGDRLLVALDGALHPLRWVEGMGTCSAVSVLRLAHSGLRPAERTAYDGRRKALEMAEIRAELAESPRVSGGLASASQISER